METQGETMYKQMDDGKINRKKRGGRQKEIMIEIYEMIDGQWIDRWMKYIHRIN